MQTLDRITFHPKILGGRAAIRSMRLSVAQVVNLEANGMSVDQIVAEYPFLEKEDIRQALLYAERVADPRARS